MCLLCACLQKAKGDNLLPVPKLSGSEMTSPGGCSNALLDKVWTILVVLLNVAVSEVQASVPGASNKLGE